MSPRELDQLGPKKRQTKRKPFCQNITTFGDPRLGGGVAAPTKGHLTNTTTTLHAKAV